LGAAGRCVVSLANEQTRRSLVKLSVGQYVATLFTRRRDALSFQPLDDQQREGRKWRGREQTAATMQKIFTRRAGHDIDSRWSNLARRGLIRIARSRCVFDPETLKRQLAGLFLNKTGDDPPRGNNLLHRNMERGVLSAISHPSAVDQASPARSSGTEQRSGGGGGPGP